MTLQVGVAVFRHGFMRYVFYKESIIRYYGISDYIPPNSPASPHPRGFAPLTTAVGVCST